MISGSRNRGRTRNLFIFLIVLLASFVPTKGQTSVREVVNVTSNPAGSSCARNRLYKNTVNNTLWQRNSVSGQCEQITGGAAGAPTDATYVTQTPNGSLSAEQALSTLPSGIMRVATTTGVVTSLTDSAGIAANISDETGSGPLVLANGPALGAASATSLDTPLLNPSGNVVEQRNGVSPQAFRVYRTFTDVSNNARGEFGFFDAGLGVGTALNIGTTKAGSESATQTVVIGSWGGSTGPIYVPIGGILRWFIDGNGIQAQNDNAAGSDIGQLGANRPRNIYAGGFLSAGRNISAKTTNYTVLAADLHNFFTNAGAGAGVTFTLPTPVVGMTYEFYRDANQTVTIDIAAGVTIRVGASVTTDGGNTTLDAVGSRLRIVAISTSQWVGDISGTVTFN